MERTALWAGPEPDAEVFDLLVSASAAAASLAGWKESVDDNKLLSIPAGLVGKLPADFSPRGISDMERELVASHHILGRQTLDADDIIVTNKLCSHLMDGVLSLIGDMLLQPRDLNASPLSVAAPL